MTAQRKFIEFAKRICLDRRGNDYVYGGTWDPFNVHVGADCSGLVTDILSAVLNGTAMIWGRESISTESYRYKPYGQYQVGPFVLQHVASPNLIPADAAVKIALHHEGSGGPHSHMWCIVDGWGMESNGTDGCVMMGDARDMIDGGYANDWWYWPGPIVEDGTPRTLITDGPAAPTVASDQLWADVSEFQKPLDDSYWAATFKAGNGVVQNYRWLCIRTNDGNHRDANFATNYARAKTALDDGRADGLFVYYYWRPGQTGLNTHMAMVNEQGGPHPKMVSMIDLESGGNPKGDQSQSLNDEFHRLQAWLGNPLRVVGYANLSDERTMWQFKPQHVPFILAGYGANPSDPGVFKFAHQYTDGNGYGGGLPEGAPPFGHCDMNSADGFTSAALAAALGLDAPVTPPPTPPTDDGGFMANVSDADAALVVAAAKKILASDQPGNEWPSRAMFVAGSGGVDDTVGMVLNTDGNVWNIEVILGYLFGVSEDVQVVTNAAAGNFPAGSYVANNAGLKARATEFAVQLVSFKKIYLAGPGTNLKESKK